MSKPRTGSRSEYMHWAKLCYGARYNLATSGLENLPLAELPFRAEDLELSAHGSYGYPPLLERIASRYGVPSKCVVEATGTSMANHLAMAALVEPGDEVLIETPAYGLLLDLAEYLGARVERFARRFEDAFAIDVETLRRKVSDKTKLIVLTNLHNPSGVEAPDSVMLEVGQIAERVGAGVLVDEVYLEMDYARPGRTVFREGGPLVVTSSLTKAFGLSGLRCGWVLADAALAEKMWRINDLYGVNPATIAQQLSVVAFDHLDEIAARARRMLATNRALMQEFLAKRPDVEAVWPTAGTVVFARLRNGQGEAFCHFLRKEYETSVVPGRFFEMPEYFRVGLGGETEMTGKALKQLERALNEFSAARKLK